MPVLGAECEDASSTYPTWPNQRDWFKCKARETLSLICTAVAGDPAEPTLLLLSRRRETGSCDKRHPRPAVTLVAKEIGRLLESTGETQRRYPGYLTGALVRPGVPLVVNRSLSKSAQTRRQMLAADSLQTRRPIPASSGIDQFLRLSHGHSDRTHCRP